MLVKAALHRVFDQGLRFFLDSHLIYGSLCFIQSLPVAFYGFESLVNTEGFQTTITMLLITAVLLVSVLMTGCTSLTEPKNSTPSGTDALTESDGFGVYIKLERDDTSSIALRGFLDYERLVCEKDSYI